MRYYANFSANNGTHMMTPIEDSNKSRIIKSIRNIANGNRFDGGECAWSVWDQNDKVVAKGGTLSDGTRYREV